MLPKVLPVLAGGLAAAVLLVGCSVGGSDESTAAGGESASDTADTGALAAPQPADAPGTSTGEQVLDLRITPFDAVIRTADLEVRVDDVRAAADAAGRLARSVGGRVEAEDRSGSGETGSATLQLRVPPTEFDAVLGELADLGEERSRRIGSEDVGEEVVDLEARLATQRGSVARVQALLSEASDLGQVVQIEGELTRRTADLESLQARLASLEARVQLSTITVRFDGEDRPVIGSALGFGDGLRAGWDAVVGTARVLAVAAGALLPFLPVLLVGAWLLIRSRRSRPAA